MTVREVRMGASKEEEYKVLLVERERLRVELLVLERRCGELGRQRVARERAMYEDYFEWELMQKNKREYERRESTKEEDCAIF